MKKFVKKVIYNMFVAENKRDSLISWCIIMLLGFGLFFSTSASMNSSTTPMTTLISFIKQIAFTVVGFSAYYVMATNFNSDKCKNYVFEIVIFEVILLIWAYVSCKIHGNINNNYSWIRLPAGMSFQPSELAKVVIVIVFACTLADRKYIEKKKLWQYIKLPAIALVLFVGIILGLQKDTGSAIIVFFLACLIFLIPDNKKYVGLQRGLLVCAVFGVGVVLFCMFTDKGQQLISSVSTTFGARFRAVTNPSYNDDGTREIFYSFLGISKGSILGVGLGNSVQKFGYLVSSEADYVFSVIVEETGLLGIAYVFGFYGILIGELIRYSKLVYNEADRMILIGAVCYLFLHFFFNIGGASGFIPLTGVPLLFLSRGGTSLVSVMTMMGIAQAVISRYEIEKRDRKIKTII